MAGTGIPEMYDGIKLEKLPRVWFNSYVVYKYRELRSTFIVGFDDLSKADDFVDELNFKGNCESVIWFNHYPPEMLK